MPLRDPTVENERVRDLLSLVANADTQGHVLVSAVSSDQTLTRGSP
jgi:hypothetical protein